MPDHIYRIIEVAGSSEKSIEDAIQNAVGRASRTLRQVGWFEVVETRGHGNSALEGLRYDAKDRGQQRGQQASEAARHKR